jgi:DNA polymerase III epsilon subunit-like protein
MGLAIALNDLAVVAGREPPFPSVSLTNLCKQFGIENQKAHDAFSDAIAEAKLYKKMLCTLA